MTARWTLSRKILLLALLNLVLLAGLLLAIARSQFGLGAESVLLGPVHDRLLAVGNAFSLEYENAAPDAHDSLLAAYRRRYGVDVFLSSPRGEVLAGPAIDLPPELRDQMRRLVPPPPRREDPPRRQAPPAKNAPPVKRAPPVKKAPPPKKGPPRDRGFGFPGEPPPAGAPPFADGLPPLGGGPPPPPEQPAPEPQPERPPAANQPADQPPPRPEQPPPERRPPAANQPAAQPPPRPEQPPPEPPQPERPPAANQPADQPPQAHAAESDVLVPEPQHPQDLPRESVFLVITHPPTLYWAGVRVPLRSPSAIDSRPAVLLLRSSSLFSNGVFFEWRLWLGAALGVIVISVACWLPFIRGLTRSIAAMDRVTQAIAQGNFAGQAAHGRRDELGDLGHQINLLGSRLESFVKNQKRFLGDIAHELSAPLARIQFALGILEQKADGPLQPHVAVLHEEVQEMSGLVNELLQFSKAGLQPNAAPLAAVDVASVIRKAAAREASAEASLRISVPEGLAALANEPALVRAVSNILRNAVRYAGSCGPIAVSAQREGAQVAISVADSGPGLPESELQEVFAPFYRPEASRTRETGGAGLGLAIVKTCVEACRGTVAARNRPSGGLEVTIRLPAQ